MDMTQTLVFRRILTEAVKKDATDLHLSVGSYPMMRVSSALTPLKDEEIVSEQSIKDIVDAIVPQEKRDVLEQRRDILFTSVFDDKIRAKVHIFYQEHLLSVSLRFLSMSPRTLRELNCPAQLEHFINGKEGLLIVGGNQDSGRTTLVAGLLEQINRSRACHIMTLEDPIEYRLLSNMSIVNQREVGADVASFEDGLDAALKEDIDVLFVSDFSTPSIMKKVLDVANAGVYVIVVMNTDSAARAVERIVTSFEPHEEQRIRTLLSDVLSGVIVQQLVPQIGGGYVSVHEVLLNTSAVRTLIVSSRFQQIDTAIKSSRGDGMMSFDHELAALARGQKISLEHAREFAKDRETLESLIRG